MKIFSRLHFYFGAFFEEAESPSERVIACLLLWGTVCFLLFFIFGRSFTSFSSVIFCIAAVGCAFRCPYIYRQSPRFPLIWPLLAAILWFGLTCFWAIAPKSSISAYTAFLYRGISFFIAGFILARYKKAFFILPAVCLFTIVTQGLDGTWQLITGYDLLMGQPLMSGRLTAAYDTYAIGNCIALLFLPGLSFFLQLRGGEYSGRKICVLLALALAPVMILLIFSKTRNGYIGIAAGSFMLWCLYKGGMVKKMLAVTLPLVALLLWGPQRTSMETALQDGRLQELWPFALSVIAKQPFLGFGLNSFNPAFRSLGLVPTLDPITIPHPHNNYLQILCDTGIIGFVFYTSFLFGSLFWCRRILKERVRRADRSLYWIIVSFFWASCVGYAAMGVFGHNFFKDWWLALGLLLFGITCGGCFWGTQDTQKKAEIIR